MYLGGAVLLGSVLLDYRWGRALDLIRYLRCGMMSHGFVTDLTTLMLFSLDWLLNTRSLDSRSMLLHIGWLVGRGLMGWFVLIPVLVFILGRDTHPCQ